ncbi:MAG: MBL fold metallo-hydrolase [Candidatus Aminicenantes bacterium]|nr:MBL fold metallo-hydrolase [Candidatus Aminicenantes bacterium]
MNKKNELKKGIHWVGGIDWDLRDFHGYLTQRGSTYNAYLVLDKKVVLIDTVKHYLFDEMLDRIREVIDPAKINYILSNHVEMDHSGSIPKILEYAPNASVITSTQGEKGLRRHFKKDWDFHVVKSGDSLNIGRRTLKFVHTPMVHWPDNMVTYVPEEKILFSNDAFGQHIASSERFVDEMGWDIVEEEAAKYYGNIVMPYGDQVQTALKVVSGLDIEMICPSHGLIWRSLIPEIVQRYDQWSKYETEKKAVIVYDSMWGSTKKMAQMLDKGLSDAGVERTLRNLKTNHISDVITDILRSRLVLVGSPTLNNGMLPSVGELLTYLKGLRPRDRVGFAFGSFGWGGQAVGEIKKIFTELKWKVPEKSVNLKFIPEEKELDFVREVGNQLGEYILKQE